MIYLRYLFGLSHFYLFIL